METAVEKRKGANGALAIPEELRGPWGAASDVDTSDVLIPKLLLMQGLSKLVAEGDAAQGEIIRSTTGKALAKKGEAVDFIPLMTYKTWVLEEKVGSKYEYRRVEPMTAANKDLPLEFVDGANQWRRNRCLNFYVLLPQDISKEAAALKAAAAGDLPDPEDALLPCVLSFRRTSYNAGKILATHFKKAEHFKVTPAVTVFKLSSTVEKNELGTFHAFTVEPGRKATVEELTVAKRWFDTLQKVQVKVDEPEVDEAPVAEVSEQDATF
jgi:hypothetical protein